MKILIVMFDVYEGGAETQFRSIIKKMNNDPNIQLHVLFEYFNHSNIFNKINEKFVIENKIEYQDLNLCKKNKLINTFYMCWRLLKYFKQNHKFDLVILYTYSSFRMFPIFKLFVKHIIYSERISGEYVCSNFLFKFYLKKCSLVTCNSLEAKMYISKKIEKNIRLIENGIVIEKPLIKNCSKDVPIYLVPARISEQKNQQILLDLLLLYGNKLNAKVIFAGSITSKLYKRKLDSIIELHGLDDKVEFLEFQHDIKSLYASADLIILPSISEGTPNVVLESFNYEVPIIASNIPCNSILFKNKKLLFDPQNVHELYACIQYVLRLTMEDKQKVAKNNKNFLERNFDMNVMVDTYLELVKKYKNQ